MQKEAGLKWLFLDLNSYFASVEQQENPALRGKPTIVVPMLSNGTCAIAASAEAKLYGIKTGTNVGDAKRMCPNLKLVQARHDIYVAYHNRIIEEAVLHTPISKIWSIDEFSSRLPPDKRSVAESTKVAHRIKQGLWKNIGRNINCSIGIAPNSLLAKIATDMQKPDGLVIINQEDLPDAIFGLRLRDLPGIGHNMEIRLNKAGIRTIEQFWNISPKHARKIWGGVQGERFWYWIHGYDFDTPETGNVMIGHSRVLDTHLRRPEAARLMARRLLVKATYRLRRKGYHAGVLSLGLRSPAGYKWYKDVRFPHARNPFTFLTHLDNLWAQMLADFGGADGMTFKKVSVILHDLKRTEEISADLFDVTEEDKIRRNEKNEALAAAMDKLQGKYQKETVWLGVTPKTIAGHVGTKIAFARVPETEEFWS